MNQKQKRLLAGLAKEVEKNTQATSLGRGTIYHFLVAKGELIRGDVGFSHTSPVSNITYYDFAAIRVCLGLANGEAAWLLDLPADRRLWLLRARKILRDNGYGRYRRFISQTAKKLFQAHKA